MGRSVLTNQARTIDAKDYMIARQGYIMYQLIVSTL